MDDPESEHSSRAGGGFLPFPGSEDPMTTPLWLNKGAKAADDETSRKLLLPEASLDNLKISEQRLQHFGSPDSASSLGKKLTVLSLVSPLDLPWSPLPGAMPLKKTKWSSSVAAILALSF